MWSTFCSPTSGRPRRDARISRPNERRSRAERRGCAPSRRATVGRGGAAGRPASRRSPSAAARVASVRCPARRRDLVVGGAGGGGMGGAGAGRGSKKDGRGGGGGGGGGGWLDLLRDDRGWSGGERRRTRTVWRARRHVEHPEHAGRGPGDGVSVAR